MKPGKKWVVDGEIFDDYSSACAHVRKFKTEIELKNLVNDIRSIIRNQPYGEASEGDAEPIAKGLLALYVMKRK